MVNTPHLPPDDDDAYLAQLRRSNHRLGDGNTINQGSSSSWTAWVIAGLTALNTGICLLMLQALYTVNGDVREVRGELNATRAELAANREDTRAEMHDMRNQFAGLVQKVIEHGK